MEIITHGFFFFFFFFLHMKMCNVLFSFIFFQNLDMHIKLFQKGQIHLFLRFGPRHSFY